MNFPVTLALRIDWGDLDLFGHVNNVMFMKYIQASRVNYWEQTGIYQQFLQKKTGPMLASVTCNFKAPLFYPGNVFIRSRMEFIKHTSFGIHHSIFNDAGENVAEAHDIMVMFNFNTNEKIPFPQDLRKEVEQLEGRSFS